MNKFCYKCWGTVDCLMGVTNVIVCAGSLYEQLRIFAKRTWSARVHALAGHCCTRMRVSTDLASSTVCGAYANIPRPFSLAEEIGATFKTSPSYYV